MMEARRAAPPLTLLRLVTAVALATLIHPFTAQAFDLSVYGHGGYDMVSSEPAPGSAAEVASPEPTGPSYGLGVSSEFVRFADKFGLGASLGFGGMSASWQAEKTGVTPSGVSLGMMGAEVGGRATFHIGAVRLFGYSDFLYGLFGNEYSNSSDGNASEPAGKVTEFDVQSAFRIGFGAGVGYSMGPFSIDLRGGMASVSMNVVTETTPSAAGKAVTDTYVGFTGGAVVSYRFLGGTPAADAASTDRERKRPRDPSMAPSNDGKKKAEPGQKPKKKRKKRKPASPPP
jgi:hypothetical protein